MQYITEETQRVAHLGFACIIFTVTMQASPLAAVVSKMYLIIMFLYVSQPEFPVTMRSGLEISTRKLVKCEWFFEVASLKNIL